MENELFDFEGLDGNVEEMTYYNVSLKVPVCEFPVGTCFDLATINFTTGHLSFYNANPHLQKLMGRYQLKFQVTADLLTYP